MATDDLPQRARVVIVGGGAVGCSVAYHLARRGWTDVVLLEQGQLSCGTTWHAAGVVGQLRTHPSLTRLMLYSSKLYAGLEAEVGLGTGWNQSGALWVAASADRMVQLRRTVDMARAQGLEAHEISVAEAGAKWPLMRTEDLVGAVWLPNDAKANPTDLTQALARGARNLGVRIFERTKAAGWKVDRGRVTSVATAGGEIDCEYVVNCGGQWAKAIAEKVGVTVPLYSAEHYYIVTEAIEGLDRTAPTLRDPDGYTYFKEEVRGLLMGGFEPNAKPWVASDEIPEPFEFQLLPEDWDQFDIFLRNAVHRVPAMENTGIKKFYNGPESFTPDHNFIMGRAPELDNYFVLAGFNSSGIAFAGGAGNSLARVDRQRGARAGPQPRRHPPVRTYARQQALASRAGAGDRRPALRHGLAKPRTRKRPRRAPVPCPSFAGRGRCLLRHEDGLGTRELVRPSRHQADRGVCLGQAELVRVQRRRASCRSRRMWPSSTRPPLPRSPSAAPTLRPPCSTCAPTTSPCAGPDGLHGAAQRSRRL